MTTDRPQTAAGAGDAVSPSNIPAPAASQKPEDPRPPVGTYVRYHHATCRVMDHRTMTTGQKVFTVRNEWTQVYSTVWPFESYERLAG